LLKINAKIRRNFRVKIEGEKHGSRKTTVCRGCNAYSKPIEQIFEAFIDPEITNIFWFSKSTGRLDKNDKVLWTWEIYNYTVPVFIE